MASEASIARNFGSPRARAVAAMASEVILLSSGPTVMNALRVGSRASSSIWSVPNCVNRDLARLHAGGAQDEPQQRGVRRRPTDHADLVPCEIRDFLDFRARPFVWRSCRASPEGDHSTTKFLRTMATVCASVGISRSPRPTASSALPAPRRARASTAPSVVIGDSLTVLLSLAKASAIA